MKVALKIPARVVLEKGIYDLSENEARRLLALGIAETVNDSPAEETAPETAENAPKKRGRKKKAE